MCRLWDRFIEMGEQKHELESAKQLLGLLVGLPEGGTPEQGALAIYLPWDEARIRISVIPDLFMVFGYSL